MSVRDSKITPTSGNRVVWFVCGRSPTEAAERPCARLLRLRSRVGRPGRRHSRRESRPSEWKAIDSECLGTGKPPTRVGFVKPTPHFQHLSAASEHSESVAIPPGLGMLGHHSSGANAMLACGVSDQNRAIAGRTGRIFEPTATADALTAGENNSPWAAAGYCQ